MNRNLVIVLAGGFLIAVLVAVLVQAGLSGKKKDIVQVKKEPRVEIIVAAKDISIGTELSDKNMKWQSWPKNAVFPGAVVRKDKEKVADVLEGHLARAIALGEPIIENALVGESGGNFVAATLAEGMRAIAVNINAERGVAGFVGPGDHVDIILTYKEKVSYEGDDSYAVDNLIELNINKMAAETILQNVRVIAVDQASSRDAKIEAKVGKTVTLEVSLRDAERLALATSMGDLSLALRKLGDEKIYENKEGVVTDARLTTIFDEVYSEILKLEKESGQASNVVRIYNGSSISEAVVYGK